MTDQIFRFNRLLLILMIVMYLISLAAFNYANWQVDQEHTLWKTLVNSLILSIPLTLFFGSIYVLISAWYEQRQTGEISTRLRKIIHWAPRTAAILIIFFVSLFSLDVFELEASPLELIGAFLIHSLPSIVMILFLVIAWRRPVVGFIAFLLAGLFFLRSLIFGGSPPNFLLFSGPLLLISALFFADWRWIKPLPPASLDTAM